jgi:tRNA-dihydrouridine synthase A
MGALHFVAIVCFVVISLLVTTMPSVHSFSHMSVISRRCMVQPSPFVGHGPSTLRPLIEKSATTPTRRRMSALGGEKATAAERETQRQDKYDELMDSTKLSLAPMMEYTDRHFRHLVRLVSSKTLLYTEMVAANALSHERRKCEEEYMAQNPDAAKDDLRTNYSDQYLRRYLAQGKIDPLEQASVLQLGGSDPKQMFEAAETVMDMTSRGWCDYTAINLNCGCKFLSIVTAVGCDAVFAPIVLSLFHSPLVFLFIIILGPSPKVAGKGCFGAALMDEPRLVADLTRALHDGCDGSIPITVKCRIGTDSERPFSKAGYAEIDPESEYRTLRNFIETVASNGIVTDFSVHARIAVLQKSYSPSDNRKIPPLKYDLVRRLVEDYPEFTFSLNGGVDSISEAQEEFAACPGLAGVMIGRSWAADPWSFSMADTLLYNKPAPAARNRLDILKAYGEHADWEEEHGDPTKIRRFITKAVTTLFTGEPQAKRYRIALDKIAGIPKKLQAEGKTSEGQPPISELILQAAHEHLSDDVLLRSPEDSYERKLYAEEKRQEQGVSVGQWSSAVAEWQQDRKAEASASASSGT